MDKKRRATLLALSVSILLLFFLLKGLDWAQVLNVLNTANILYLLLWIPVFLISTLIRSIRWKFLLNTNSNLKDLYDSLNIGNLCNMVLPLRAGEFIRPYLWAKFSGGTFGAGFGSVVLERVFDVFGLFFVFLIFVPSSSNLPELLVLGAKALGLVAVCIGTASIFCYIFPVKSKAILSYISSIRFIPQALGEKIQYLGEELILGLSNISSVMGLMSILFFTILIWLTYLLGFYVVLAALDPVGVSFVKAGVVCVFISLCVAAPSAPGFIGTFQLGCSLSLMGVFAYSEEFSIAYSIIGHSLQFIGIFILGFLSLLFRGLKFSSLQTVDQQSLAQ